MHIPNQFRTQLHQTHYPTTIVHSLDLRNPSGSMSKLPIVSYFKIISSFAQLTDDSDLFFSIDFDRRCDSTLVTPSDESCELDLSGDLPTQRNKFSNQIGFSSETCVGKRNFIASSSVYRAYLSHLHPECQTNAD